MPLNKLEIPTTDEQLASETPKLGTVWVAPGEGSTWLELWKVFDVFGTYGHASGEYHGRDVKLGDRTNLKLTGAPITPYDRQRWESGNVE